MQHVLKHCHNRDPLLWPPAVTAAFKSSVESIPHLADLASQQPANMPIHQDNVASMAAVKFPASFPRHVNVFADIGLDIG